MANRLRWPFTRDLAALGSASAGYSTALGAASVATPLLAVQAGYGVSDIGILIAISAIAQMGTRVVLGVLMRIVPDWTLVAAAGITLAASNLLLAMTTAVLPFVISQLLQGVSRACFWTGSQTHVVRGPKTAAKSLATLSVFAQVGLLAGPVLAGILAVQSPASAMAWSAVIAAVSVVPTFGMDRLRPFQRLGVRAEGRVWRRPAVVVGCWAGATAGAWRGVIGAYVPVVLTHAGHASNLVGGVVAVVNASTIAGSLIAGRVHRGSVVRVFVVTTLGTGATIGAVGFVAERLWLVTLVLAASGVVVGTLQTLGPAIASDAVHPEERGEAIAVAGTFRAASLFIAPFGVAVLMMTSLPLAGALAIAGAAMATPAMQARRLRTVFEEDDGSPKHE